MTYVDVHNNKVTNGNNYEHRETYHNKRAIRYFKLTVHTQQKITYTPMLLRMLLHYFMVTLSCLGTVMMGRLLRAKKYFDNASCTPLYNTGEEFAFTVSLPAIA